MRIRVLGPVEVERDGAPVAVGGPQQRRLLALLVAQRGRVVSTERLVEALWPDGDAPDGAARSMRTYVVAPPGRAPGRLDHAHGAAGYALESRRDGPRRRRVRRPARRGRAARCPTSPSTATRRRSACGAGEPFGEFGDEWWALPESSRLDERRIRAAEQRAAALMAMGHHNRAIPDLERLVAEHPLR